MKLITITTLFGLLILVMVSNAGSVKLSLRRMCTGKEADLVFILDSSSSIWGEHFQKQLDFVKYMIEHLDIGPGPNRVRIGVETFSDHPKVHINLNSFLDSKRDLISKIDQIPQILGNTSIGSALREMREVMFTSGNGARPNVRHVAIIITDGTSQDEILTQREARLSRDDEIELFVIGIGNYISEPELKGIASNPKDKYLYLTASYEVLDQIRDDVIKEACRDPNPPNPPNPTVTPNPCDGGPADIIFVLDSSSSIWREHFQKQLNFVKYLINHIDVGRGSNQVRIGVETFSDLATIHIFLNNDFDKYVLKWKVDQIPQILGNTSIGDALREMRETMFTPSKGSRPNVRHVAIILTDGTSQDERMTQEEARLSREANIELFVIGIGNYISPMELRGIASTPKEKYLFLTPSFEALDKIREDVIRQTCIGASTSPRPPTTKPHSYACNAGKITEVVFVVNNNHFGHVKTHNILKTCTKIMEAVEKYSNVSFGIIFDNPQHPLDRPIGTLTDSTHLEREFSNHQFGPFVSLIKKIRKKVFYGRSLNDRRIGFLFIDRTIDLNPSELLAEAQRLSFEVIELYAAVIGYVDEELLEKTLLPKQHIIRIHSFDQLIHDLPSLFAQKVCKPVRIS